MTFRSFIQKHLITLSRFAQVESVLSFRGKVAFFFIGAKDKGYEAVRHLRSGFNKTLHIQKSLLGPFMRFIHKKVSKLYAVSQLSSTGSVGLFCLASLVSFPLTTTLFFQPTMAALLVSYIFFQTASFTLLALAVLLLSKRLNTFSLTMGPWVLGDLLGLTLLTVSFFIIFSVCLSGVTALLPWPFYLVLGGIFFFLLILPMVWKSFLTQRPLFLNFYEKSTMDSLANSSPTHSFHKKEMVLFIGFPGNLSTSTLIHNNQAPVSSTIIGYLRDPHSQVKNTILPCLGTLEYLESHLLSLHQKNIPLSRLIVSQQIKDSQQLRIICNTANRFDLPVYRITRTLDQGTQQVEPIGLSDFISLQDCTQATWDYGRSFTRKRLLVTGAGTMLGHPIVLLLASFSPTHLHLMDACPFSLRKLQDTLLEKYPNLSVSYTLDSLLDPVGLSAALEASKPDHILHLGLSEFTPLLAQDPLAVMDYAINGTQNLCSIASTVGVKTVTLLSQEGVSNDTLAEKIILALCEQYFQNQDVSHQLNSQDSRFLVVRTDPLLDEIEVLPTIFLKSHVAHRRAIIARETDGTYATASLASLCFLRATDLGGRPSQGPGNLFLTRPSDPVPLDQIIQDLTITVAHKKTSLKKPLRVIESLSPQAPTKQQICTITPTPYQGLYKVEAPFIPLKKLNKVMLTIQQLIKNREPQAALEHLKHALKEHTHSL